MPIASLQRRLTQVGVIRLGEKRVAKSGKEYPAALSSFRITSPSRLLIDAVAAAYGGTVKPWQSPSGPEFEVTITATEMPVLVPPQNIDPNFELWGNGFRARLCDGVAEKLRGQACLCEQAARQRYERQNRPFPDDGRFERTKDDCKPTTRLALMLADIPSMGTFKLESHGWNAAAELPMLASAIANAAQPIPALLRLEARSDKRLTFGNTDTPNGEKVEPRNYVVPVLDFFGLFTPKQAFGGALDAAVRQAIGGGTAERAAIGATPEMPQVDWLAEIEGAGTPDDLNALRGRMQAAGVRDQKVVDAWKARTAELVAAAQKPAVVAAPAVEVVVPEPVDGEVEPDRDDAWSAILRAAKAKGMNLPAVEAAYRQRMGHDPVDDAASGWSYQQFLTALKNGEVQ